MAKKELRQREWPWIIGLHSWLEVLLLFETWYTQRSEMGYREHKSDFEETEFELFLTKC